MKRVKREGRSNKRDVGFSNEKTVAEAGVYLPSFIFGVVTALLLGLLALSQLFPSVAQQSAIKTSATPTEPVSVAYLKSDRFGRLVELSSIDGLMDMLVELGRADVQTLSNFEIEKKSRQEIAVADELLTRKLNDNNREFAIETKIGSLSVIYGLGFSKDLSGPDATEDLRVFASTFLVDSNPRIARVASLAQFKQLAFERLKVGQTASVKVVCESMMDLIGEFPADPLVIATIQQVGNYYIEKEIDDAVLIVGHLDEGTRDLDSEPIRKMLNLLQGNLMISVSGYKEAFNNRWINGVEGNRNLVRLSQQLLQDDRCNSWVIEDVDQVARWLEQQAYYESAGEIYRSLFEKKQLADGPQDESPLRNASRLGKNGLTRLNLVNTKIDLDQVLYNRKSVDLTSLTDRVVVLLLWSNENIKSINGLLQTCENTKSWRRRGGKLLAISIDEKLDNELLAEISAASGIIFGNGNIQQNGANRVWEQCPTDVLPRAMLIDRSGIVVDIDVPISQIQTQANFLISDE
jgi:hypothetical protein